MTTPTSTTTTTEPTITGDDDPRVKEALAQAQRDYDKLNGLINEVAWFFIHADNGTLHQVNQYLDAVRGIGRRILIVAARERARQSLAVVDCPADCYAGGEICSVCGCKRAPSGVDGGKWVHV